MCSHGDCHPDCHPDCHRDCHLANWVGREKMSNLYCFYFPSASSLLQKNTEKMQGSLNSPRKRTPNFSFFPVGCVVPARGKHPRLPLRQHLVNPSTLLPLVKSRPQTCSAI
ncbi:hypothetical protein B0H10DRAFT_2052722 [Mycena sp. CBHHK59/15]|nr:hypothetical protein B0H10DRAFT_2052722 [Mycena sp. CBHHK59/15]